MARITCLLILIILMVSVGAGSTIGKQALPDEMFQVHVYTRREWKFNGIPAGMGSLYSIEGTQNLDQSTFVAVKVILGRTVH